MFIEHRAEERAKKHLCLEGVILDRTPQPSCLARYIIQKLPARAPALTAGRYHYDAAVSCSETYRHMMYGSPSIFGFIYTRRPKLPYVVPPRSCFLTTTVSLLCIAFFVSRMSSVLVTSAYTQHRVSDYICRSVIAFSHF